MNTRKLRKELNYKIPQLKLALIRERQVETFQINTPSDIAEYVEPLKYMPEENFLSFHLDARNQLVGYAVVSHGTLTASLVHPREVFKGALLSNAHTLIVAHNHPAGSLAASREDLETTKQLISAGRILGVEVLDHIIVSHRGNTSIREMHPQLWLKEGESNGHALAQI